MNLSKRDFLRAAIIAPVAASLAVNSFAAQTRTTQNSPAPTTPFTLPALPYDFAALEPHIDAQTMQLHHDRHHKTYVDNLNKAVLDKPFLRRLAPEDLIRNTRGIPVHLRETIRNNGGGHVNHTMFWQIMSPQGGGEPTGEIARVIRTNFGGFDKFKQQFNEAGTKRFGSGWVWLVRNRANRYSIISTPNQENPMMQGLFPVMGNDVWEHAYYLKYNNRRADYLNAWWNVVSWDEINNRLGMARS
jgi:Fe-Mn family superoxide dismutase